MIGDKTLMQPFDRLLGLLIELLFMNVTSKNVRTAEA